MNVAMIAELSMARRSAAWANPENWHASSHTVAPAISDPGRGSRASTGRMPLQVTAYEPNRMASASPIETRSDTEPYMPYSAIENARKRCAHPHQATAQFSVFWTHTNSSNRPSIASISTVRKNSVLRSMYMHRHSACRGPPLACFRRLPNLEAESESARSDFHKNLAKTLLKDI